jgi:hypothetical protein
VKVLKEAIAKENAISANSAMSGQGSSTNFVRKNFGKSRYMGTKLSEKNQNRSSLVCSKCTLKGHKAVDCKVKCKNCHKLGHIKANWHQLKRERQHNVEVENEHSGHNYMLKVVVISQGDQGFDCSLSCSDSALCDLVNPKPDLCNTLLVYVYTIFYTI